MATAAMTEIGGTPAHEHPWALTGSEDPSAGAGVVAPIGTLFIRNTGTAGTLWVKTGAAATAWALVTTA